MGAGAYPVAYRAQAAKYAPGGFQKPGPPIPANDNNPPGRVIPFPRPARGLPKTGLYGDNAGARAAYQRAIQKLRDKRMARHAMKGLRLRNPFWLAEEIWRHLYRWRDQQAGNAAHWDFSSPWIVDYDCGAKTHGPHHRVQSTCGALYSISQSVTTGWPGIQDQGLHWLAMFSSENYPWFSIYRHRPSFKARLLKTSGWHDPWVPATPDKPMIVLPRIATGPAPAMVPENLPIGQPVVTPKPVPFRWLRPYRTALHGFDTPYSSERGPAPAPKGLQRYVATRAGVRSASASNRRSPPPARTKERKFIMAIARGSALGVALNATTEALDFVNALYWALPADKRYAGRSSQNGRIRAVLENFDHIQWDVAFKNLIANQVIDYIGGRIGRLNAKASRRAGFSTGFMTGPLY